MTELDHRLSPHFSPSEFHCTCCGEGTPKTKLVNFLEAIRFIFTDRMSPAPVKLLITGPLRCREHNSEVEGAAPESRHIFPDYADGVDIKLYSATPTGAWIQINPDEVYKVADDLIGDEGGCGKYKGRTHCDVRGYKARWEG